MCRPPLSIDASWLWAAIAGGYAWLVNGAASPSEYVVEVWYREPTYEAHVGPKAEPYTWRYRICAASEAEAQEHALGQFKALAEVSSVGWVREVIEVKVSLSPRAPRA